VLAWWDSPAFVTAFLVALIGLSVLFASGVARHAAALLLWYGRACLFNRNVPISNPSIAYVGLLLLLTTVAPRLEPLRVFWEASRERRLLGSRSCLLDGVVIDGRRLRSAES
jgi:hypothetical protein